ncbi:MAG: TonB-dependent receptor, partial [Salinivirgaceae bacterium]|nr:TonB-dependent receptor [Salinivirgaceae bacterium]
MKKLLFVFQLLFVALLSQAQFVISGKVTDVNGNKLAGANVQLEHSPKGAVTDLQGCYQLEVNKIGNYTLTASFLGFTKLQETVEVTKNLELNFTLTAKSILADEIIVKSTRADANTPVTFSLLSNKDFVNQNLGQDLPYLLSMTPSLVTSSDAGAGVGYTGLWIRGSNIQRINVTVNGIPLNDPESHGVFWVNMPDFTSSVNSLQIQRGVGTSTNGGGAFGATINLETNTLETKPFAEINSVAGSFNTFKNNIRVGTGLINDKWAFEGRLSKISSDGYIDRASSDLKSFFVQGGFYSDKTMVKAVVFSGKEKTYQAWWGVDNWTIENLGRTFNWAGYIENNDGSFRFYDNQTDNYQQDHYQLHLSQKLGEYLKFNAALHYTYGRGYYEEYNQNDSLKNYPIGEQYFGYDSVLNNGIYSYFYHDTVAISDIIVRRWLDNHFYGTTYSLDYTGEKLNLNFGGAINNYANAKHFGEILWAQYVGNTTIEDNYYNNIAEKLDINNYIKATYAILANVYLFGDLQVRMVDYFCSGNEKGGAMAAIDKNYLFLNPKVGISYKNNFLGTVYASYALSNREPIRTDFLDAPENTDPEPETLRDIEFGARKNDKSYNYNINFFFMKYTNQLALTGELNDVGSPIRANVGKSYRLGIEIDGGYEIKNTFTIKGNIALSNSNTNYK